MKASSAPARIPGQSSGTVTVRKAVNSSAPSTRAASSRLWSIPSSRARTMTATKPMLKAMWAMLIVTIPLGIVTISIAHIAFNIGFVAVIVRARLEGVDQNLEEAALVLGADEFTAFRTVTVPLLWPGILAGALLAFILSFDDYVITSLVSGTGSSTLPIVVYSMVRRNIEPSVNAISTLILLVTSLGIWLADRLLREQPLAVARSHPGRRTAPARGSSAHSS